MEQNFATHQFATLKTDDLTSSSESDDDSEVSFVIEKTISAPATTTEAVTVPATRGTLHFFTPRLSEVFD